MGAIIIFLSTACIALFIQCLGLLIRLEEQQAYNARLLASVWADRRGREGVKRYSKPAQPVCDDLLSTSERELRSMDYECE